MIGSVGVIGTIASRRYRKEEDNPVLLRKKGKLCKIFSPVSKEIMFAFFSIVKFYRKVKAKDKEVLEYYRVPYFVWGVGMAVIIVGVWLMYVANSQPGDALTISGFQGKYCALQANISSLSFAGFGGIISLLR